MSTGTINMTGGTLAGATNGWDLRANGTVPTLNVLSSTATAYINCPLVAGQNNGLNVINVVGGNPSGADLVISGRLNTASGTTEKTGNGAMVLTNNNSASINNVGAW